VTGLGEGGVGARQPVNVGETVTVDGQLKVQPTWCFARKGALNNVPVTGVADAPLRGQA